MNSFSPASRRKCPGFRGISGTFASARAGWGVSAGAPRLGCVLIGSHVRNDDPLAAAEADGADVVQFFLGDPQSWKKPKPREDAEVLKASSIPLYVHAPYLINVASANNRVRIPSRKILQDTCDAAAEVGATAVIVHGGHADDKDMEAGFERWVKALDRLETTVPVYLENTAGGEHAMARYFDTIGRLWDHIGDYGIGFCLDTCHAWAAGEALVDAVRGSSGSPAASTSSTATTRVMPRVRGRPARQLRQRPDRPATAGRGGAGRRRSGHLRDLRRRAEGRHRVPARERLRVTLRSQTGVERRVAKRLTRLSRARTDSERPMCVRG